MLDVDLIILSWEQALQLSITIDLSQLNNTIFHFLVGPIRSCEIVRMTNGISDETSAHRGREIKKNYLKQLKF